MARYSRKRGESRNGVPRSSLTSDAWDVQRDIHLLTQRLLSERQALVTWQMRLKAREAWERDHVCTSQVPALRQECARCHGTVLELERRLAEQQVRRRSLLAAQRSAG